jgi:DNA mismatch repair protein MutS2
MKVPIPDLVPSIPQTQPPHPGGTATIIEKPEAALHDLDLRGMTGDEAIPLVDKFIDTAVLAGLGRVDIIHGKGTGALRKKVTDYLSRNPHVRSFRMGEWNEGGAGATVVELKD